MTPLAHLRRIIPERRDLFPNIPSDQLWRDYWEQRALAEAAAFDGDLVTSRSYHRSARRCFGALRHRGELVPGASVGRSDETMRESLTIDAPILA